MTETQPVGTEKYEQSDLSQRSNQSKQDATASVSTPKVDGDTTLWYHPNGKLHRDGAPAIIWGDGSRAWYQHGNLHRLTGPAFEGSDGTREWFQYGDRHRLDGPAVQYRPFMPAWWLWGLQATEAEVAYASSLSDEVHQVAAGLAVDWDNTTASLLDTAVLLVTSTSRQ